MWRLRCNISRWQHFPLVGWDLGGNGFAFACTQTMQTSTPSFPHLKFFPPEMRPLMKAARAEFPVNPPRFQWCIKGLSNHGPPEQKWQSKSIKHYKETPPHILLVRAWNKDLDFLRIPTEPFLDKKKQMVEQILEAETPQRHISQEQKPIHSGCQEEKLISRNLGNGLLNFQYWVTQEPGGVQVEKILMLCSRLPFPPGFTI